MITDWDDAYANSAHIPGAGDYPPRWARAAEAFRAGLGPRARLDLPYGEKSRNRYDLFFPELQPRGLVVFVHGGYWRAFDKSTWSWLAAGPLAHGWAVAMPSYTLAPDATIAEITMEIGAAIGVAAQEIEGPIRLAGHSAGGHLVTRMNCWNAPLWDWAAARIERTVSISGVHDLRPLIRTAMNEDLRLDWATAAAESPALIVPREGARVICWVGAAERPEFVRQNALLANVWHGLGARMSAVETEGEHHFDVIDGMSYPGGALATALCGE